VIAAIVWPFLMAVAALIPPKETSDASLGSNPVGSTFYSEVFAEFGVNLATKILRTGLHKIALNFCGGAWSGVVAL
jgi:hypothetical protein